MSVYFLHVKHIKKIGFIKDSKFFKAFIFLLVLYFTFILRAHNYDRTPTSNHLDEMLYAWSGLYLIETGTPVSWSALDYPKRAEVYKGRIAYKGGQPETYVTLYKPWLDEPPLFSLLVGYFAHINKADRGEFVPSSYIRIPLIFIASLTSIMIFLIARFLSGYWVGILSMIIYGTTPLIVFASRTAMPENLIALNFTLIFYLLLKFINDQKFVYVLPVPVLIGLSGLSKPTGYLLLPFGLYFIILGLYKSRKIRKLLIYLTYLIVVTVPFIVAYYVYGNHYDSEIFNRITSIQSARPVGFGSLAWFFITPAFDTYILRDSFYVFCLLSAAFFIFLPKEGIKRLVSLTFVYWLIVVMLSGGENDLLPWYRFASFPTLSILGAWGLIYLVQNTNFFTSFLSAGLLLGNRVLLVNAFRPNVLASEYRFVFSMLVLPSLLLEVFSKVWISRLCKFIVVGVVIIGIYINSKYIYSAFDIKCESKSCPFVPSTSLSTLNFPFIWRLFALGNPTYR